MLGLDPLIAVTDREIKILKDVVDVLELTKHAVD